MQTTTAIEKSASAIEKFFRADAAGGVILFAAALLALAVENSDAGHAWREHLLLAPVGIVAGGSFTLSLEHFVNDALMAIFFLLVGLEIKRNFLEGALSSRSLAILPAVAAVGGMIGPAVIYAAVNWGDAENMRGWAVPVATDIAFTLGVLSLLGRRVPVEVKVFLTAIAVIDDLLAIAIIALFYAAKLDVVMLALAGFVLLAMRMMNHRGVTHLAPYLLLGAILWGFVLLSGVHATLAGVATAMCVPLRVEKYRPEKAERRERALEPPLIRLEHDLNNFVTFFVLPLFAFINAGVNFTGLTWGALLEPVPLGIALGLVFGKTVGIYGSTWAAVRLGWGALPSGANWPAVFCVAILCGIGFTVSLFIGNLGFGAAGAEKINAMKLGVLAGSTVAGVLGFLALRFVAYPNRFTPRARARVRARKLRRKQ